MATDLQTYSEEERTVVQATATIHVRDKSHVRRWSDIRWRPESILVGPTDTSEVCPSRRPQPSVSAWNSWHHPTARLSSCSV